MRLHLQHPEQRPLLSNFTQPTWRWSAVLLYLAFGATASSLVGGVLHAAFLVVNIDTKLLLRPAMGWCKEASRDVLFTRHLITASSTTSTKTASPSFRPVSWRILSLVFSKHLLFTALTVCTIPIWTISTGRFPSRFDRPSPSPSGLESFWDGIGP